MALAISGGEASVPELLFSAASMVPATHYLLAAGLVLVAILYSFLEFHLISDLGRGLMGHPVALTFHPASEIYEKVVTRCRTLRGRYLATPWLTSPHLQTAFLNFHGNPPLVTYRRQLFIVRDGGTIALDWLFASDVAEGSLNKVKAISRDDKTPIVVVVPGLTSDSASAYIKHVASVMAKQGWNVIVSNHRGLAGISITSDCFYNAGWTEDVREVVNYLHREYPKAPLFAVGTSIGANILVKYLGEQGENTPFAGAASICSPWDLVICDRFIGRKLIQRLYNRVLTSGLKGYAQLHQSVLARLANWEGIKKSCSVREFDNHATRVVGKFETVDTFYRCCSSANFVRNVAVPSLCINALDDPVCTREAIPWDECRANKNIILATTKHGGHLAYFQGLTAHTLWWVEAVHEFFSVLHSSQLMHEQKMVESHHLPSSLVSSIDRSPYVNVMVDGMIAPSTRGADDESADDSYIDTVNDVFKSKNEILLVEHTENVAGADRQDVHETTNTSRHQMEDSSAQTLHDFTAPIKRSINHLSRRYGLSMWLLAYIAIITTWPVLGSWLKVVIRKRPRASGLLHGTGSR